MTDISSIFCKDVFDVILSFIPHNQCLELAFKINLSRHKIDMCVLDNDLIRFLKNMGDKTDRIIAKIHSSICVEYLTDCEVNTKNCIPMHILDFYTSFIISTKNNEKTKIKILLEPQNIITHQCVVERTQRISFFIPTYLAPYSQLSIITDKPIKMSIHGFNIPYQQHREFMSLLFERYYKLYIPKLGYYYNSSGFIQMEKREFRYPIQLEPHIYQQDPCSSCGDLTPQKCMCVPCGHEKRCYKCYIDKKCPRCNRLLDRATRLIPIINDM